MGKGIQLAESGDPMTSGMPRAGWYPDPNDAAGLDERWWTGSEWTETTRFVGHQQIPGQQASFADRQAPSAAQPGAPNAQSGQVLIVVGEISCTADAVITPNGSFPIRGSEWLVHDGSMMTRRIPPYAIVLAIAFALLCLIGLLFLLIQEDVCSGSVTVTVKDSTGHYFTTSVPVRNVATVAEVRNQVNYCRYLSSI